MDEKTLELLKKIAEVHEDIKQDKINRLEEQIHAPYTEVGEEGYFPKSKRAWLSDTTTTPQGLAPGMIPAPKSEAIFDRIKLEHEPNLNIKDLYSNMEQISQKTSDPRLERFKKLFGK